MTTPSLAPMHQTIDENDISSFCVEAAQAGDEEMAELCERALIGDAEAREVCEKAILAARALVGT